MVLCASQRIGFDVLLDRRTHLRRCSEVAGGRHQASQRLVRALKIVALDEETQPSLAVREVGEDRATQEFIPQRLPKALDLAARLRMLRPTLDVPNSILAEPLLEERLTSPGCVLSSLIGEDFFRRAEASDAALQRLQHQRAFLVMRQREAHHEARVVVHERRQIQPLVASQQKREDVRLPHLIRSCAFEAAGWSFTALYRAGRRRRRRHSRVCQNAAHRILRDPQSLETLNQISNPARAILRVLLLQRSHRHRNRVARVALLHRPPRPLRHQCLFTAKLIGDQPIADRHLRNPEGP